MRQTAEKLLLDLTELSIYAGCQFHDGERLKSRLGEHLALPVLVRVPNWVRNTPAKSQGDVVVSLNQAALDTALQWAERSHYRKTIDKGNGRVSLGSLFTYWGDKAGFDTYWEEIPQPQAGQLPQKPPVGPQFEKWIRDTAFRILTEEPPVRPMGERPVRTYGDEYDLQPIVSPTGGKTE